jgi:hypothetical protein
MTDLTSQQALEQAVRNARAQLADGALVQGTLEHLWRVAYAAGVRAGSDISARGQVSLPPGVSGGLSARLGGWRFGVLAGLKPGMRFTYGGLDPAKPLCERAATAIRGTGGLYFRMEMADTGERLRIPAMCWWRPVAEEEEKTHA